MTKNCFVIMPFSKSTDKHTDHYWSQHFNKFLKPLIESVPDCKALRSEVQRTDILRDIITHLITDEIVIADLTDLNANVFWELGIRQSFMHGTITIAEYGTKLPFDVFSKGTLFYHPGDHLKNKDFEANFVGALKDCLNNPNRPDSQVLETISGRGSLFEILRKDECIRRIEALISEISTNEGLLAAVWERAVKNKENKERKTTTSILRTCCIEFAISQRYLDTTNNFYKMADTYLGRVLAFNAQLGAWENSPESTNTWLISMKEKTELLFKNFSEKAKRELERLQNIPGK